MPTTALQDELNKTAWYSKVQKLRSAYSDLSSKYENDLDFTRAVHKKAFNKIPESTFFATLAKEPEPDTGEKSVAQNIIGTLLSGAKPPTAEIAAKHAYNTSAEGVGRNILKAASGTARNRNITIPPEQLAAEEAARDRLRNDPAALARFERSIALQRQSQKDQQERGGLLSRMQHKPGELIEDQLIHADSFIADQLRKKAEVSGWFDSGMRHWLRAGGYEDTITPSAEEKTRLLEAAQELEDRAKLGSEEAALRPRAATPLAFLGETVADLATKLGETYLAGGRNLPAMVAGNSLLGQSSNQVANIQQTGDVQKALDLTGKQTLTQLPLDMLGAIPGGKVIQAGTGALSGLLSTVLGEKVAGRDAIKYDDKTDQWHVEPSVLASTLAGTALTAVMKNDFDIALKDEKVAAGKAMAAEAQKAAGLAKADSIRTDVAGDQLASVAADLKAVVERKPSALVQRIRESRVPKSGQNRATEPSVETPINKMEIDAKQIVEPKLSEVKNPAELLREAQAMRGEVTEAKAAPDVDPRLPTNRVQNESGYNIPPARRPITPPTPEAQTIQARLNESAAQQGMKGLEEIGNAPVVEGRVQVPEARSSPIVEMLESDKDPYASQKGYGASGQGPGEKRPLVEARVASMPGELPPNYGKTRWTRAGKPESAPQTEAASRVAGDSENAATASVGASRAAVGESARVDDSADNYDKTTAFMEIGNKQSAESPNISRAPIEQHKTGSSVARELSKAAKDPDTKETLDIIADRLERTGDASVEQGKPVFVTDKDGTRREVAGIGGVKSDGTLGVKLGPRGTSSVPQEELAHHELLHVAQIAEMKSNPEAKARVTALADEVAKNHPEILDVKTSSGNTVRDVIYGKGTNADEFMAYGLSDPAFQKALKGAGGKTRFGKAGTAWNKFVSVVMDTLKIPAKLRTAVERVMTLKTDGSYHSRLKQEFKNLPDKRAGKSYVGKKAYGEMALPAQTAKKKEGKLKRILKGDWRGAGDAGVRDAAQQAGQRTSAEGVVTKVLVDKLSKARKLEKVSDDDIVSYWTGDRSKLHDGPVKKAAEEIRQHIQEQSKRIYDLIDHLITTKNLSEDSPEARTLRSIGENMGEYAYRSFQAKDDKHWSTRVKALPIWDESLKDIEAAWTVPKDIESKSQLEKDRLAKRWGLKGTKAERLTQLKEISKKSPAQMKEEALALRDSLVEYIDQDAAGAKMTNDAIRRAMAVVMQRTNPPEWLKKLWGEYKDPSVVAAKTLSRMADFAAKTEALMQIRAMDGIAMPPTTRTKEHTQVLDGPAYGPLNGYRVRPEDYQMLNEMVNGLPQAMGVIGKSLKLMSSWVRQTQIALNLGSAGAQWVGNGLGAIATGHMINPAMWSKLPKAAAIGAVSGFEANPRGWLIDVVEGVRHGVLQDSALGVALTQDIRDLARSKIYDESKLLNAARVLRKGLEVGRGFFATTDEMWKYFVFDCEKALMKKAFPDMPEDKRVALAAKRTRRRTVTFSEAPNAVKKISQQGVVIPFATYMSESVRSALGNISLAAEDIGSGNPVLRAAGVRAMIGSALVLSQGGIIAYLNGDNEEDLRNTVEPYDKAGMPLYQGKDEDDQIQYLETSRYSPWPIVSGIVGAALRGDGEAALWSVFKPVASEGIGVRDLAIVAVGLMEKKDGRLNAVEQQKFDSSMERLATLMFPRMISDPVKALTGNTKEQKEGTFDLTDFFAKMIGYNPRHINPLHGSGSALAKATYDYQSDNSNAVQTIIKAIINNDNPTQEQLNSAVLKGVKADKRAFDEYAATVGSLKKLGKHSDQDVLKAMKEWNLSPRKDAKTGLLSGEYIIGALKKSVYERAMNRQLSKAVGGEYRAKLEANKYTAKLEAMLAEAFRNAQNELDKEK